MSSDGDIITVSTDLELLVNRAAKLLVTRYKKDSRVPDKKRVSISMALKFFIEDHDPRIIERAEQALEIEADS